ncbi:MAG TPA: IS110 family transposase [Vineibacter sp.]|nr:IS110 family transposase [Vineibacter sp.]
MSKGTLYVGLDTDKKHIDVAVAEPLPGGEVRYWGKIANTSASVEALIKKLGKGGRSLVVCYEAGPCGYGLYRQLSAKPGVTCEVVAPSLIPRRSGDRVKTNRRDAVALARLRRAEELTAIWVPDEAHEAMRDLVRARATAVTEVTRCQQHIGSFLLRQGIAYGAGAPWSKKHRQWLGTLKLEHPAHRLMLAEMLLALDQALARRRRLSEHIEELLPNWSLAWLVEALQALRGYRLVNAATLVSEIGDPRRFESPRKLMGFLGLNICERSTGEKQRRTRLTKTGSKRGRKALIEAAWTYKTPPTRAKAVAPGVPAAVREIADKASHRLSRRYRHLLRHGKLKQVAVAAVARESLGFIWAIAHAAAPAAAPH